MGESFKLKTFENVGYNAVGRIAQLLFQGAANIVLARNLASSDYGIAGFAMIVIGFSAQFGDLGVDTAILQTRDLDERGLYTGFTIKAALGLSVFAALLLLAPLAGYFLDSGAAVNAVRLLSLNFLINIFAFLPRVALTRGLDSRGLLTPQLASVVVNSTVAIAMARAGFGYWSIISANVLSTAALAAALNFVRPLAPRLVYDREKAADLLRFGGNIFFTGLLVFLILNADNFIVGVVKGPKELGYYALAFNWGAMICFLMGSVVSVIMLPTLSKFQNDRPRLKNAYLRVFEYVLFLGVFANAGLLAVSAEFLSLVLGRGGDKWLPALEPLRVLCFYGVLRVAIDPVWQAALAMGKTGEILRAQMVVACAELLLVLPALWYFGITGVAAAVTAAYFLEYIMLYPVLMRELGLTLRECLAPALPAVAAGAAAAAAAALAAGRVSSFQGLAGKLALYGSVYCLAYGLLTGWKMVSELRSAAFELRPGACSGKRFIS